MGLIKKQRLYNTEVLLPKAAPRKASQAEEKKTFVLN